MPPRIFRSFRLTLIVSGVLAPGCLPTDADERAARMTDGAAVYETLRRASVEILVDGRTAGCGCFVDAEGLVLTAAHVVKGRKDGIEDRKSVV